MRTNIKLFTIFLIITICSALIFTFLIKSEKKEINKLSNDTIRSIDIVYNSAINTFKLSAQKEHHLLINNKEAMNILKKFKVSDEEGKRLLRGDLYRLFYKHYKYLKSLKVRQFHFHTVEGKSLLRFHVPHSNGDLLIDTRYSIELANKQLKPSYGFEGGKIYPGFRYLFPIVYEGEHLGSIEYSVSFEAIEEMMKNTFPDYIFQLKLDQSISYNKVFKWYREYFEPSELLENHFIENPELSDISNRLKKLSLIKDTNKMINESFNIKKQIKNNENFALPVILKDKGYIISFYNINDISNKHAAYLITYTQNDTLINIYSKYKMLYLLVTVIMMVIFILSYIIHNQVEKILSQNEQLEKTNIDQFEIIKKQKNEFETIFDTTKDGIAILDFNTNFLFFNKAYETITGYTKEELIQKSCKDFVLFEDDSIDKKLDEIKQKGFIENFEKKCSVKNGKKIHVNMSISLMPDKKRLLLSTKDLTESKKKDELLNNYIELIDKNIISSSTDLEGNITFASTAFCKISGYKKEELLGKNHRIIKHPETSKETFQKMWETINSDNIWEGEVKNLKKDGGYYWVKASISPIFNEDGKKIGYTSIRQDITDKKRIEEISITDGLTNIYNRRYFNEIFPKIINSSKRTNELVSFIIMDIDHFKQYNDTYGHHMGDDVLIKVSSAIKNRLKRADDYCFRLGGEEFGIIFKTDTKEKASEFANIIKETIENLSIKHEKNSAGDYVTASMGLVCKNAVDIKDEDELYKEADTLLYDAKESGRNRVSINKIIT